jgi:hypothetical protein
MKILRVAVAAAGSLALLVQMALAEAPTKWRQFQPSGAGYRIEFPGTPKVTKDTLPSQAGPAPHLTAALTSGSYNYLVELTTYASASPREAVLDLYTSGFAKTGTILAQTDLKIGSDSARRLELELKDGQVVSTMLVVTDGTRVYWVSCTSMKGTEHTAKVTHFIDSFALVP